MPFLTSAGQQLTIEDTTYRVAEHPAAPGMPYGQEGRQAEVYQLVSGSQKRAVKVFKPRYRVPGLAGLARRLAPYADLPGLQVCRRSVLTPQHEGDLLRSYPDLLYAVLMPWVEGPTWMEVVVVQQALSPEESLHLANRFASVLSGMEQDGLAHCDISGPNVLLPALATGPERPSGSPVALVDVEQMYGPDLRRPELLPGGSSGYAHKTSPEGFWSPDADRFAGAAIIAEMLGWCDERVRQAAWGESYFSPEEMQKDSERYKVLDSVLRQRWGDGVARLFERAWYSDMLSECPTFGEWLVVLPGSVPAMAPARPEREAAGAVAPPVSQAAPAGAALPAVAPSPAAVTPVADRAKLDRLYDDAREAYSRGQLSAAKELLAEVVRQDPDYSRDGQLARGWLESLEAGPARPQPSAPAPPYPQPPSPNGQQAAPAMPPPTPQPYQQPAWTPPAPQPAATGVTVGQPKRRNWALLAIPAVLVVLLVVAAVFLLQSQSSGLSPASATATADAALAAQGTQTSEAADAQATQQAIDDATAQAYQTETAQVESTAQALAATSTAQIVGGTTAQAMQISTTQAQMASTAEAIRAALTASPIPPAISVENRGKIASLRTLRGNVRGVSALAFSADGKLLATGSQDTFIRVWNVADGSLAYAIQCDDCGTVASLAFSPDGSMLASSGYGHLDFWSLPDGLRKQRVEDFKESVRAVAFSPDGSFIAACTGSNDGRVVLLRPADGQVLKDWQADTTDMNSLAISPDGKMLVVGSSGGSVKLWQLPDGNLIRQLSGPTKPVNHVAFSPDGQLVAAGGEEGKLWMWSVADGTLKQPVLDAPEGYIYSLGFSTDGQVVAAAGSYTGNVYLWRVKDGASVGTLGGQHIDSVYTIAFSPDGRTLATGGRDDTTHLWGLPPPDQQPTPAPVQGKVGQTVQLNDLKFTVKGVRHTQEGRPRSDGTTPEPSQNWGYVVIDLEVQNTSSGAKTLYVPGELKVIDTDGGLVEYSSDPKVTEDLWEKTGGKIAPGATVSGELGYEVAFEAKELYLLYMPIDNPGLLGIDLGTTGAPPGGIPPTATSEAQPAETPTGGASEKDAPGASDFKGTARPADSYIKAWCVQSPCTDAVTAFGGDAPLLDNSQDVVYHKLDESGYDADGGLKYYAQQATQGGWTVGNTVNDGANKGQVFLPPTSAQNQIEKAVVYFWNDGTSDANTLNACTIAIVRKQPIGNPPDLSPFVGH